MLTQGTQTANGSHDGNSDGGNVSAKSERRVSQNGGLTTLQGDWILDIYLSHKLPRIKFVLALMKTVPP